MVISIETTMQHPKRGFIKLEDTVIVTDTGHEALGDGGRGWNRAGSRCHPRCLPAPAKAGVTGIQLTTCSGAGFGWMQGQAPA